MIFDRESIAMLLPGVKRERDLRRTPAAPLLSPQQARVALGEIEPDETRGSAELGRLLTLCALLSATLHPEGRSGGDHRARTRPEERSADANQPDDKGGVRHRRSVGRAPDGRETDADREALDGAYDPAWLTARERAELAARDAQPPRPPVAPPAAPAPTRPATAATPAPVAAGGEDEYAEDWLS